MRRLAVFTVVALLSANSLGQDKPKPNTPESTADKVLAAFKAKDEKALKALAEKDDPDPWLVADELCLRGEHDAAEAFAVAAPRKDVDKLPAYVSSVRERKRDDKARAALVSADATFRSNNPGGALAMLDAATVRGDSIVAIRIAYARGFALRAVRRLKDSANAFVAAADAAVRVGWLGRASAALHQGGVSAYYHSDFPEALRCWERRLALEQFRGNEVEAARLLGNIGEVHRNLGNYASALEHGQQALRMQAVLGDRAGIAACLVNIGVIHVDRGDFVQALSFFRRGHKEAEAIGHLGWAARALGNIGNTLSVLGDYTTALKYREQALKAARKLGARRLEASALGNIGHLHYMLGDYARALECQERSLKMREELADRAGMASALGSIGDIHIRLGEYEKALAYQERALNLNKEIGSHAGVAQVLSSIGSVHHYLEDYEKALDFYQRSLNLDEELGRRAHATTTLANIGATYLYLGDYVKALELQQRVLEWQESSGSRSAVAASLGNIGKTHAHLGDFASAAEFQQRALRLAEETGSSETIVLSLGGLSEVYLRLDKPEEAAAMARRAVESMCSLVGRLGVEQGASARERWVAVFEAGIRAALRVGEPSGVWYFLESGRAGALLESLGGREGLGDLAVPAELRREEIAARAAVLAVLARHSRALEGGRRKEIEAARAALGTAHEKVLEVVSRIQRTVKATADVTHPKAAPLGEIRAVVAKNEALVLYALLSDNALALVVTQNGARIVSLGKTTGIATALQGLSLQSATSDPLGLTALQQKIVAPLALGKDVRRLLISPHGALSYVPFVALLAPDREVVMVPSGTTYGALRDELMKQGRDVLALGDPDYGVKTDERAMSVMRSGDQLAPLPGTRAEVKAVGDRVLLGRDASEGGLRRVIESGERWRSVHLACHGLIRVDEPQLSSLALTPDPENDGFLSVLDIFRMKIPADLVVLSACETARGKVYKAEGIVGFTRAFMMAGAPRVIVSLWKVDDKATQSLMVEFYRLWNPKDGSKGLPTATALKRAQDYVRDHPKHPKWKHPYYWAAWQLWGLGD